MPREYDKLVRDDVPRIIRESGETPVTHVAEGDALDRRLRAKLVEEAAEFGEAGTVKNSQTCSPSSTRYSPDATKTGKRSRRRRERKRPTAAGSKTAVSSNGWREAASATPTRD